MDISKFLETLQGTLGGSIPGIIGAVVILIVGWLLAVILRVATKRILGTLKVNNRIESSARTKVDLEKGVATGLYYVVLLFVAIAVLNILELEIVTVPLEALVTQIFEYIPRLVAGGVLLLVAWLVATILRMIATKGPSATNIDQKLSLGEAATPISQTLGNVIYWFTLLVFLPAILSAFNLEGLLVPVQGMVGKILDMVPNIVAASVIALVGWFIAKILRDIVSNLLAVTGIDRLGENAGLRATMSVSRLIGLVVYIFVLVPALIAALNALQIEVITVPATEMLGLVMAAIPNLFAAAIILAVAYFLARLVSGLVSSLLGGMGFDRLPQLLDLGGVFTQSPTPSQLVGRIIVFFIMLFAAVETANRLGFSKVSQIVAMFIQFGGQILLGTVILAVGLWLSKLAYSALTQMKGGEYTFVAGLVRITILVLVAFMGLRAMGLADDIVNMAFGLSLGAVAVAIALSFGLGGREAAGKIMESWANKITRKKA